MGVGEGVGEDMGEDMGEGVGGSRRRYRIVEFLGASGSDAWGGGNSVRLFGLGIRCCLEKPRPGMAKLLETRADVLTANTRRQADQVC